MKKKQKIPAVNWVLSPATLRSGPDTKHPAFFLIDGCCIECTTGAYYDNFTQLMLLPFAVCLLPFLTSALIGRFWVSAGTDACYQGAGSSLLFS